MAEPPGLAALARAYAEHVIKEIAAAIPDDDKGFGVALNAYRAKAATLVPARYVPLVDERMRALPGNHRQQRMRSGDRLSQVRWTGSRIERNAGDASHAGHAPAGAQPLVFADGRTIRAVRAVVICR
jgi:hypothetical protein